MRGLEATPEKKGPNKSAGQLTSRPASRRLFPRHPANLCEAEPSRRAFTQASPPGHDGLSVTLQAPANMANAPESTLLDDYYDLTAEEEALLCQIDTHISPLAAKASAADASTDSVLAETPLSHASATVFQGDSSVARQPGLDRVPQVSRAAASASTPFPTGVVYPDCMSSPSARVTRSSSPTD